MKTSFRNLVILASADFRLLLRMNRAIIVLLSLIIVLRSQSKHSFPESSPPTPQVLTQNLTFLL